MTLQINDDATGCIIGGTPSELLDNAERYFAAVNALGHDLEYFSYEVIRPNNAPDLQDADAIDAIQDNAITDVTFENRIGGDGLTSCTLLP